MVDLSVQDIIRYYNITQKEFAVRIGLRPAYVNDIIRGRAKGFSNDSLKRIQREFGVSIDWFLTGQGSMFISGEKPQIYPADDPDAKQTIPLLGSIAAGLPTEMVVWQGESVQVPPAMVARTGKYFALRVRGDSMLGANIQTGDIAVLRQVVDWRLEVHNRDIVAAAVDGEATLKTFFRDGENILLRPENPAYQDVFLQGEQTAALLGLFVGLLRFAEKEEEKKD